MTDHRNEIQRMKNREFLKEAISPLLPKHIGKTQILQDLQLE